MLSAYLAATAVAAVVIAACTVLGYGARRLLKKITRSQKNNTY